MTMKDENQQAFGYAAASGGTLHEVTGMSLRDYFAAKAINSIMLHPQGKAGDFNEAAKDAYEIADAMMGARK
jgi:hypothetical protein